MNYNNGKAENLKIAYIGGGSRGWAWKLMSDLALEPALSGTVCLYDIDPEAAKHNEIIGNNIKNAEGGADNFRYVTAATLAEATKDADFVVISILPGTFDEMAVDVHAPEKYGIYQSVGDTAGPGGTIRALRCLPMIEEIAYAVRDNCPDAWVINYTNPMTMCVRTLYKAFPQIKAFGCCHEVFGTQEFLARVLDAELGIKDIKRNEIKVNVVGINHFTWLTEATYRDIDIFPVYRKYCEKYHESGAPAAPGVKDTWETNPFISSGKIKMDLFLRYGAIAAAGDRHLAEFCPGKWYLKDPETVKEWHFGLTSVSWRKEDLKNRLEQSRQLREGEKPFEMTPSGEEGVHQIKAILGLEDLVTNVNMPNYGQVPNLPLGAVVETNARFTSNSVRPVFAGNVPQGILGIMEATVSNQENTVEAAMERDIEKAFISFLNDQLVTIGFDDARKLYDEMVQGTKAYLKEYNV
ncbi:MAG TPA: alpha-glucosidase/alpha-galactosidase [Candidatus Avimonoglobus intestinipullorum]|uniref:Alpha-glucosidase/alpha-galactosidase n=1 Tax=Candidatus Avimonoglobus intestinipullorum TaxID=2840699 RepID=A0A9D1LUW6_9FIRM|nr:alpha-glucosidase/alpha-galactosidase [Candidatus Avimonoglobus intestinipullorum]